MRSLPDEVPQEYWALVEGCWAAHPDDRPDIAYAVAELERLLRALAP